MRQKFAPLALVTVLLGGLAACSESDSNEPPPVVTATMNVVQAAAIETALSSDKAAQTKALAPELQAAYTAQKQSLPKGTAVKIDMSTFKSYGDYGQAEADAGKLGRFVVHFLHKNGSWFVVSTEPKQSVIAPKAHYAPVVPAAAAREADGCLPDVGTKTPVLFVHGLRGSIETWTDDASSAYHAVKAMKKEVAIDAFDYKNANQQWVDHPEIGPKLARHIDCLAENSRKAGGSGKVIVIAHSMGGLATRFAASQTVNGRKVADDIGLLITIGTPNKGSHLADIAIALTRAACHPAILPTFAGKKLQGEDPATCGEKFAAIFGMQTFTTSGKIAALPALPNTVPVLAIAGDVRIAYSLFNVPILTAGSDLVVAVNSAGASSDPTGAGTKVLQCSGLVPIPGFSDAPCEHGNLVRNPNVHALVVEAIRKYAQNAAPPPVGTPLTFNGMTLYLPTTWKVVRVHTSNHVSLSNDKSMCVEGRHCPFVTLYHVDGHKGEIWNNQYCKTPVKKGGLQMGYKQATYYQQTCFSSQISHIWEIADAQILVVSEQKTPEIETVLQQARWS